MNGWRVAAGLLIAFGLGWTLRSWRDLATIERARAMIIGLRAAQDHHGCRATIGLLSRIVAEQQGYINTLEGARDTATEHGPDLADATERWLREAGL